MPLRSLIDEADAFEYTIAVVGEDEPGPLAEMLESMFEAQPIDLEAIVHTGKGSAYRDGWFVVYRPDDPDGREAATLVCLEVEHRIWDGFWTTDPARVAEVADAISCEL